MIRHHLDHAASSPLRPVAAEAMAEAAGLIGNPSSLHTSGRRARSVLEEARESIAASLGSDPAEVVLTSGGTEADNLAVIGGHGAIGGRVVTTAVEHPAVGEAVDVLAAGGAEVTRWPVEPDGTLRWQPVDGGLVSVMWVNNETGVMHPVEEIAHWARTVGIEVHSDAVQAIGVLPVDFAASGLDLMTVSAHKLGGPVGIGALLARREARLRPIGHGGGQERELRSGTVPVALAVGFAAALAEAVAGRETEAARLAALRRRLVSGLVDLPGCSVVRPDGDQVSPAIVNARFAGVRADDVLLLLDGAGIDCSTGSACTAGVSQPSEVLIAMGCSVGEASAALRFSTGWTTTEADVDAVLAALPAALDRARTAYDPR